MSYTQRESIPLPWQSKLNDHQLVLIQSDYESGLPFTVITHTHHVNPSTINKYAKKFHWNRKKLQKSHNQHTEAPPSRRPQIRQVQADQHVTGLMKRLAILSRDIGDSLELEKAQIMQMPVKDRLVCLKLLSECLTRVVAIDRERKQGAIAEAEASEQHRPIQFGLPAPDVDSIDDTLDQIEVLPEIEIDLSDQTRDDDASSLPAPEAPDLS